MNIVYIGANEFSYKALVQLYKLNANISGVITRNTSVNADYRDLALLCREYSIPYQYVKNINSEENVEWIKNKKPDIVFCFGWSQLLKKDILDIPPMGVIGYHPAELPLNRGRHPLTWALSLGLDRTASTFFFIDEGADAGDILSQEPVEIRPEDDAGSLYAKVINIALGQIEKFLPLLESRMFTRIPQDGQEGNTWRKRHPADGKIDWRMSASNIHNLVRALAKPYIGAHFVYNECEYIVWRTRIINEVSKNSEPGKVLLVEDNGSVIKCGESAIQLLDVEPNANLEVGIYL